ncbi:hypothetical protein [Halomontanus rarus]|uniref:hypothetical protein n=1 Tax=Halomontanus rarus TaxID=3034020 RepID=UPI0023E8F6A6|nr:hypothetical protein [Halovivax sp. TS33]
MSTAANTDSNSRNELLYRFLKELRGSLLLSMVAIGFVLIFVGVIFESSITVSQQDDVLAGMFGVFGVSAIIGGGVCYIALKILHRR